MTLLKDYTFTEDDVKYPGFKQLLLLARTLHRNDAWTLSTSFNINNINITPQSENVLHRHTWLETAPIETHIYAYVNTMSVSGLTSNMVAIRPLLLKYLITSYVYMGKEKLYEALVNKGVSEYIADETLDILKKGESDLNYVTTTYACDLIINPVNVISGADHVLSSDELVEEPITEYLWNDDKIKLSLDKGKVVVSTLNGDVYEPIPYFTIMPIQSMHRLKDDPDVLFLKAVESEHNWPSVYFDLNFMTGYYISVVEDKPDEQAD